MEEVLTVCGDEYRLIRLLGHGKGGYSYLAVHGKQEVVLKQIHHEPCDYYNFGNKIEAERNDYERLRRAGIRIPSMIAIDTETERIVIFGGRLAEYKYYDMAPVIEKVLNMNIR